MREAVQRSRRVADRMAKGVEFLFRKNKITLFPGAWPLRSLPRDRGEGDRRHRAHRGPARGDRGDRFGAAVASRRRHRREARPLLERRGPAERGRPTSLAVIGAGAVGVEFADVYSAYGTQVTILEALPRVAPHRGRGGLGAAGPDRSPAGASRIKTGVKVTAVKPGGAGRRRRDSMAGGWRLSRS